MSNDAAGTETDDGVDDLPDAAREEIARSVRSALAKHGYANLTTKQVAAESAKSEAFFFYHCDSKADLILVFLDWAAEYSLGRLASVADDPDPARRLYRACDVLLGDPSDDLQRGTYVAIMELLAHAPHDEAFAERLTRYERRVLDDLAGFVRSGIESGDFRDVEPERVAGMVLMTADGTAGAVMALGMRDVGENVRAGVFEYLDRVVLAEGRGRPAW
jgi:AcrR family transcriptional regulator